MLGTNNRSFKITRRSFSELANNYPHKQEFVVLAEVQAEVKECEFLLLLFDEVGKLLKGLVVELLHIFDLAACVCLENREMEVVARGDVFGGGLLPHVVVPESLCILPVVLQQLILADLKPVDQLEDVE